MRHLFPTLLFLLATLWLPAQTWTLSWSDEFNGTAIDNTKWGYDIGTGAAQGLWGWGNGELQYYTDDTDNADVLNGNLVITARQENFSGSNYTSARTVTRNKFSQTYGKWEARIDLPTGQGIWPAFWMLRENNPWPGEIDIMEIVGHLPGNCHGTAHWGEVGNVQSMGGTITSAIGPQPSTSTRWNGGPITSGGRWTDRSTSNWTAPRSPRPTLGSSPRTTTCCSMWRWVANGRVLPTPPQSSRRR